jgi:hypothetical protein
MTPDPGASAFEERLHALAEGLAMLAAAEPAASEHDQRAARPREVAAARRGQLEEDVAETLRLLATGAVPTGQRPHRPRLEESKRAEDRERGERVIALLRQYPHLGIKEVARRCGVHPDVVRRVRRAPEGSKRGSKRVPRSP